MKTGKFGGLVFRELYLGRKQLLLYLLFFLIIALGGWLVMLSFRYGNIGMLLDEVLKDSSTFPGTDAETVQERMRSTLVMFMKFMPAVMSAGAIMTASDIIAKDTVTAWNRYLHCTPVTPLKYASVKVTVNFIFTALSLVMGLVHIALISLLSGNGMTYSDLSAFVLLCMLIAFLSFIAQIWIILLRNRDLGMLASLITVMVPIWIIAWNNRGTDDSDDTFNTVVKFCEELCPWTPLIFTGMLALLFAALYLLYKRREK